MDLNIIFTILLIFIIFIYFLIKVNNYLVFRPYTPTDIEYDDTLKTCPIKIENLMISTKDNRNINAMWLNKNINKNVILYAHGNQGWCGNLLNSKIINILLNYGSVIIFDYAGYGVSEGIPSENNTYIDISTIYEYLIEHEKINSSDITVYGFSLGTAIVTKLVSECNKETSPGLLILEAPFLSIRDVASDINTVLKYFTTVGYNNEENLGNILKKKCKTRTIILHSKDDEIIKYTHGKKLSVEYNIAMYKLTGLHNSANYGNVFNEIFTNNVKIV